MASSRAHLVFAAALLAIGVGWTSGAAQRGQPPNAPAPSTAPGTAFIAGQVIESPSGRAVAGASVSLVAVQAAQLRSTQRPVVVDSQGRFFFADLAAGTYRLIVDRPGYTSASQASQARLTYAIADGERITDVKARLVKLATLAGAVRDDAGDPVVGTDVIVVRRSLLNGRPALSAAGRGRTDDRGAFHLTDLAPGEYFVCACSRDPIPFDGVLLTTIATDPMSLMGVAARALKVGADVASLDSTLRTFAPTFYPASSTVARATRVTLASGEDKSGVDITLTPVRSVRVSGTIVGATGPVMAQSIRLVPAGESEEASALVQLQPVLVQPDGRFDFAGVPPGQYVLRVNHIAFAGRGGPSGAALAFVGARGADMGSAGRPAGDPPQLAAEALTVGEEGVSGLSIVLGRGVRLSGRLEFTGARPAPEMLGRGAVVMRPFDLDSVRGGTPFTSRLTPDGTFDIGGLAQGRYTFETAAIPGWTGSGPKSVRLAGADVTDLPISVEAADLTDLIATFTDLPMATISGAFSGDLRDELSVVVFPSDRRYWADPAAATRRLRTAPILRNGTFTIAGLPPGEYFVAVVPDEAVVDWQDARRLETFARTAQRVALADGEKKTLSVKR